MLKTLRASGLTLVALALTVTATPASAARISRGTTGNDTIVGHAKPNRIMSLGGRDDVSGRGGNDTI